MQTALSNFVIENKVKTLLHFFPYLAIRPYGLNGKIVLHCFVQVYKKYKARVGNRQIGVCGLLAKNVSVAARDRFKLPDITTDRTV